MNEAAVDDVTVRRGASKPRYPGALNQLCRGVQLQGLVAQLFQCEQAVVVGATAWMGTGPGLLPV